MLKKVLASRPGKWVLIALVLAVVGTGAFYTYKTFFSRDNAQAGMREMTAKATRGDLSVSISGTGTVQPISRYDIVPLIKGNIISAPFDDGMNVKAGDLLYRIDDSDLSFNIEKSENNIEKMKMSNQTTFDSIEKLDVTSPVEGRISNFTLTAGDQVGSNSKIADIYDHKNLTTTISFNESQTKNIKVGQSAQVLVGQFLRYFDGTVKYVNYAPKPSSDGSALCDVEVSFESPGGLVEGMATSVVIRTDIGDITNTNTGVITYTNKKQIVAETSGKVKQVLVKDGEWVTVGQKLIVLDNDSLSTTSRKNTLDLKDAQLSLDAQKKQLNDYNILSPINGKVIKKYYKAGDTINNGNSSTILMTVADMTKMIFDISVDELDIAKVAVGQKVVVTADALPGTTFAGEVSSVLLEGKSSNGVTVYPVQVTIPAPGKLIPGMNVNAKIMVENKKNVLNIPMSAVTKLGNKAYVWVKAGDSAAGSQEKAVSGDRYEASGLQPADSGSADQARQQRRQSGGTQGSSRQGGGTGFAAASSSSNSASMEGRQRREVVIGINNDSSIEIVSGLSEGETVYLPSASSNSSSRSNTPNVMGGGMSFPGGGGNVRIR